MMFRSLAALLKSAPTILVTVARADEERLRITITPHRPKKKGEDDDDDDEPAKIDGVLNRPLVLTGTPDELDVELPAHLERWAQTRTDMKTVFADLEKQLDEAKKAADEAIAAEKKRGAIGAPTITKPAPVAPVKKAAPAIL